MFGGIEAGAAQGDSSVRGDAGHLREDEGRAPLRTLAVVNHVPVRGAAVRRLVLGHRRHHDPVLELHLPKLIGREHRRAIPVRGGLPLEPGLGRREPLRVAQAQVLVTDSLGAGQQAVVELYRVQIQVALHVLEPFGGVPRRRLQLQHLDPPVFLIPPEGRLHVSIVQIAGQGDGRLQRQLGSRADGEMRGGRGIAQEHQVLMRPAFAENAREVQPGRAPQMVGVRDQTLAIEMRGEDALAGRDALLLGHAFETESIPGLLRALDDEVAVSSSNW